MSERGATFDAVAADYDSSFTTTDLGRRHRHAVWRRADLRFTPGMRVLDLGCGTGEDAAHLAERQVSVTAVDGSSAMVVEARRKFAMRGLADRATALHCSIDAVDRLGAFDGVLSNFGALNCVPLPVAGRALTATVRPGGWAVLVVMGPHAVWEWVWFLAHGRPRAAFRRFGAQGVQWRGLTIYYPTCRALARALRPAFQLRRVAGIGAVMPPPFAQPWADRHAGLLQRLDRFERAHETSGLVARFADHYVAEFERVG